jgi:hypothetical protein
MRRKETNFWTGDRKGSRQAVSLLLTDKQGGRGILRGDFSLKISTFS